VMDVLVGANRNEMAAFPGQGVNPESDALGERLFGAPARQWAAHARASGRKAWAYRFDAAPSIRFGACHCIELPFVFGNLDAFSSAPMLQGLDPGMADRLTGDVQRAWLDFANGREPPWRQSPYIHVFN
jgi:Carboxylesterase type B